jgi:ribokinase
VVLNPSPFRILSKELLSAIDLLVLNEGEAAQLTAGSADALALKDLMTRHNLAGIVITQGGDGAQILTPGETFRHIPGYAVPVEDTTGCGDAFTAALCSALASDASIDHAVRVANAVGAFAAGRRGAQSSYPTADELAKWLKQHEPLSAAT